MSICASDDGSIEQDSRNEEVSFGEEEDATDVFLGDMNGKRRHSEAFPQMAAASNNEVELKRLQYEHELKILEFQDQKEERKLKLQKLILQHFHELVMGFSNGRGVDLRRNVPFAAASGAFGSHSTFVGVDSEASRDPTERSAPTSPSISSSLTCGWKNVPSQSAPVGVDDLKYQGGPTDVDVDTIMTMAVQHGFQARSKSTGSAMACGEDYSTTKTCLGALQCPVCDYVSKPSTTKDSEKYCGGKCIVQDPRARQPLSFVKCPVKVVMTRAALPPERAEEMERFLLQVADLPDTDALHRLSGRQAHANTQFIIVPVNSEDGSHWYYHVISRDGVCITADSIYRENTRREEDIYRWIHAAQPTHFNSRKPTILLPNVTQQTGGNDCGLFVLQGVYSLAQHFPAFQSAVQQGHRAVTAFFQSEAMQIHQEVDVPTWRQRIREIFHDHAVSKVVLKTKKAV